MASHSKDRIVPARIASFAAAALLVPLAACSAPRTWPAVGGAPGMSTDTPPLPQVVISAVKFAHEQIAKESPLVYNLPSEMNVAAFPTFERGLAPGEPMCPGDTNVWTVRQARIDGSKAQVDIEYPSRDGFYQSVTVHMDGAAGGFDYKPKYLQYWKVPVKDPVCQQPIEVVERTCGKPGVCRASSRTVLLMPWRSPASRTKVTPQASASRALRRAASVSSGTP